MVVVSRKGNNGRGARRRLFKKVALIGCLNVILLIVLLVVLGGNDDHRATKRLRQSSLLGPVVNRIQKHKKRDPETTVTDEESFEPTLDNMLKGRITLVDVVVDRDDLDNLEGPDGYQNIRVQFCRVQWYHQKENPSNFPMFRDLINVSDCSNKGDLFNMDLRDAVAAVKAYDQQMMNSDSVTVKQLDLKGVAFHESRCGSTLFANICVSANPVQHRVYSESPPPIYGLKVCGENFERCSVETAAQIVRDIVYLMGRTDDMRETNYFLKIQSLGSRHIEVFRKAFPNTPWLYIYRDPVQVMMSHFEQVVKKNVSPGRALCVARAKELLNSPEYVDILKKRGKDPKSLSFEETCAFTLSTYTESAVKNLDDNAIPVNYKELPDILYEKIIPDMFGVPISEENLKFIEETAHLYSKGRGKLANQEFKDDSAKKEKAATQAIRDAAQLFLAESYEALEKAADIRRAKFTS